MPETPHTDAAISARGLSKSYRGRGRNHVVHALENLSFSVPYGRVFKLLGPNGAGKSTTTKILTTLSTPDAGTAEVAGFDILREPKRVRQAIGYVSQGSSTDPFLTAAENLEIASRMRGLTAGEARVAGRRLLDEFGLSEAGERPVRTFSGGMRRRLDVAAALVHRPRVLFLDEPTTGLDPEARSTMWDEIRRLAGEESLTVILTTHYMEEADRLADELIIVNRGKAVVQGTPDELKSALRGDTIRVALIEPDAALTRHAVAGITGIRDVIVEVSGVDGVLVARSDNASAAVGAVIAALDAAGIRFGQVAASHPTLDDVYLHFVGHTFDAVRGETHSTTAQTGRAA